MRIRHVLTIVLAAGLVAGCGTDDDSQNAGAPSNQGTSAAPASNGVPPGSGTVMETVNGGGYTYVKVDLGAGPIWAAGPQATVKAGDHVTLTGGMEMRNFTSKTLERTFDVVYFVNGITVGGGMGAPHAGGMAGHGGMKGAGTMAHGRSDGVKTATVSPVERVEGGQTVEEVVGNAAEWSGKEITIRGHVVKFNGGIMGKNWLHLQDGTGSAGTNDLTVTTDAVVNLGDIVIVKGVVVTDRDFGSGYKYDVIVEEAIVTKDE